MDARDVDDLVDTLALLNERIAALTENAEAIKGQLRALGEGTHGRVIISAPSRRFDAQVALAFLDLNERAECVRMDWDPVKIKSKLRPDQLDQAMVAGNGKLRVTVNP